jgi:acetyl-CoA C-acetyltransferase
MVSTPYTKLMTAIMDVDMAAAVLVATEARADALGVPADRRVYLRGAGSAEEPAGHGHPPDHGARRP